MKEDCSKKSYIISVCLSGIFGVVGIHHFYVERWMHGLFDFSLFVIFIYLISNGNYFGFLVLLIDCIHTVYVTYKLIIGEYKDGKGKFICIPEN
jgi:TM2 domain-containing membrane protein YozV